MFTQIEHTRIESRRATPLWQAQQFLETASKAGDNKTESIAFKRKDIGFGCGVSFIRIDIICGAKVSIIVTRYNNERGNTQELVERFHRVMEGLSWEVIFVNDTSPDQTVRLVREIGRRDSRVRCIERADRRCPSSAYIQRRLPCSASYLGMVQIGVTLLPATPHVTH
jgi:hypothetical protein